MELKLRKNSDIYIIDIIGQIDIYTTGQVKELFLKMLEGSVQKFVINMEAVTYLDSSAIGTLINIYSICAQSDLKFALVNLTDSTQKVMELTRLEDFFPIFNDLDTAMPFMQAEKVEHGRSGRHL